MKFLFLMILWVPLTVSGSELDLGAEIERINAMDNVQHIHQELLLLKQNNLDLKQKLIQENSYRPDLFHYSTTLELLLGKIPVLDVNYFVRLATINLSGF